MSERSGATLHQALEAWREGQNGRLVSKWLNGLMTRDGTPRAGEPKDWWKWLRHLSEARQLDGAHWPTDTLPLIQELLRSAMRWSRAPGVPCFEAETTEPIRATFEYWIRVLHDPPLQTVGRWWFTGFRFGSDTPSAPPLPAHAATGRVLAMLRADWNQKGDLLAIDQPGDGAGCRLEWVGHGQRWLGPDWGGSVVDAAASVRLRTWETGPYVDYVRWSHLGEQGRTVQRVAILLRGRGTIILGQQVGGLRAGEVVESRLRLARGVTARPIPASRALLLQGARAQDRARVVPLALPDHDSITERGSLRLEGDEIILSQRAEGTRVWMPLLLTVKRPTPLEWRNLTISRQSRIVRGDVASAVRFRWDRDYSLIIYKALAKPALHSLIGHQTSAAILLAWFNRQGEWNPFLEQE